MMPTLSYPMAKSSSSSTPTFDAFMRLIVLHGTERFLIEEYTRQIASALQEKFGGIEQFSFDGETAEPALVLDELRSYGLMQKHKLVILDSADSFLAGGGKGATEDDAEEGSASDTGAAASAARATRRPLMERYAENPVDDATLLMRARTWRPGKLDKLIAKVGLIVKCEPYSPERTAAWCMKRVAKRYDATLDPDAAQLLVERLGTDMLHLDTELLKLAAMAGKDKTITRQIVAESVGLSREEKAWEIQSAVVTADAAVMLRKLRELLDISQQDEVPITWAICDVLRKMHTASQLLRRGVPPQGVFAQAKLWGSSGEAALRLAREHEPAVFAQLLRLALLADQHAKSGVGDPQRNLEGLLVRIADRLSPVAA